MQRVFRLANSGAASRDTIPHMQLCITKSRAVTQKMVSAPYSKPAVLLVASMLLFRSLFKKDKLGLRAELDPLTQ